MATEVEQGLRVIRGSNVYWDQLEVILGLGGTFTSSLGAVKGRVEFCAPYPYSAYPVPPPAALRGELEPVVVTARSVPLRARPDHAADTVALVGYELVKYVGGPDPPAPLWYEVEVADGRRGWIESDSVRDPTDYHACFVKIDGRWEMSAFSRGSPLR
jgi:hypothetical protein